MSIDGTTKERLAVIETEIKGIKTDVAEIKTMIENHSKWENSKYESLKAEFASKWVEKVSVGLIIATIASVVGFIIGKV
jgi:hypothetical protein